MRSRIFLALLGASALALWAQTPPPGSTSAPSPTQRLIQEIAEHSGMMANLEELCDGIGPRLTGSHRLRRAQAWAKRKLEAYGAVNVHEEPYDMGRPWVRGVAQARLLNANGQSLSIAQMGWTEGTHGVVRGDVVVLDVRTLTEFQAVAPSLAGKVVLVVNRPRPTEDEQQDLLAFRAKLRKAWLDAQIALTLLISDKESGLLNMGGGPAIPYQNRTAFISQPHANLLRRLLTRHITPRVEAELGGTFGPHSGKAHNLVADIRGEETPEEMVIVGAHLDSWDLGTGATDNGTGSVVAMEVLRAMQALRLRPKRTLRVVLFSGEEQGLLGSTAYLAAHTEELNHIQAVLIDDGGSGRITGFPDMEVEAWDAPLTAALAPAKGLGAGDLPWGIMRGSDEEPFFERGIPAFGPMQDPLDYRTHTHHSEMDSLEHVVQADLTQGAQVMAVMAWGLLHGKRLLHQPCKVH